MGKQWKQWQALFSSAPKSLLMVTAAMKLKDTCSLEEKLWQTQCIKKQRHYFTEKVCTFNAMVFPVVMYGCEGWIIKKAEHWRIYAFELWCWRLLRVPWTARKSNQSILKEISPEYSLCIHAYVFIHPAIICLLVGAFKPFVFKVIIDKCDPITISLIVLGLFSVGRAFPSPVFPAGEVPLAFVVKLVWWCWINFCLSGFWFLHQIWREVLLGRVFLVVVSFLSSLSCHSLLTCTVSVEKSADSLMAILLHVICHFILLAFIFVSLITMSRYVPPWFILPGLSVIPELGWLFPLPCSVSFQLLSLQIFS